MGLPQMELRTFLNGLRNVINFGMRYPWVRYGRNVHVQWSTKIWAPNKLLRIGDNVGIGYHCDINTDVIIGSNVLIGSHVGVLARDAHTFRHVGRTVFEAPRGDKYRIVIEDDVWIGWGAIVLSGVRIGRGAIIGAGSVIRHDVPAYAIVAPRAAEVVGCRFDQAQISEHERALGQSRAVGVWGERGAGKGRGTGTTT